MTSSRVLILDDDPQIRRLVSRLLRADGVEVLMAASTREADLLLEGCPVQLLLCDHHMPEENGLPYMQRIKKRYPLMTRVLITGCGDAGVGVEAINKAQVHRCITKPFDGRALRATVRELLDPRATIETGPGRSFTKQHAQALNKLAFDHPGIADLRRNTQGAVVIEDDLADLADTFSDWSQAEDDREIKTHADVVSNRLVNLRGA